MWARYRVAELEGDYDVNRGEIRRLGKAFGLVTRETSLIVLDRVEDYARYEIAPPAELLAAYEKLRATAAQRASADRQAHLERIVRCSRRSSMVEPRLSQGRAPGADRVEERGRRSASAVRPSAGCAERDALRAAAAAGASGTGADERAGRHAPAENAQSLAARSAAAARKDDAGASVATHPAPQVDARRAVHRAAARRRAGATSTASISTSAPGYADSTAFFLDAADLLLRARPAATSACACSRNLAEMDLENRHVLRILGLRLMQAERPKLAVSVFRKVLELAPEEPQSYRDLGLAYAADRQYQAAIDTLREVVVRPWHGRFPEIELITLAELNAIVATAGQKLDVSRIDPRLLKNLPLDLRVVLTWDADNTDIDLWVTDPNGERAYYGNRLTYQGGRMSLDFTGGYGPEEFSLKHAKPGKYKVEAQFYGNRQQVVAGATTLELKLATGFGTPRQKEQSVTLRLRDRGEIVAVGEFEVAAD